MSSVVLKMLDDLPEEIVLRVLCMLPVKDVVRCTSLRKSFYSLINSNFFIHIYNQHARLNPNNPPLIFIRFIENYVKYSLLYDNDGLKEYMPLQIPSANNSTQLSVIGCCNSVVCLFDYEGKELTLWNPCIHKTLTLPRSNFTTDRPRLCGLGFVDETSDYKVLMVNSKNQAELYSLQHNSWKIVADTVPLFTAATREKHPVCVRSSLYWISCTSDKSVVRAFDLKDEVFGEISLPEDWDSVKSSRFLLRVHKESSIAVVRTAGRNVAIPDIQIMNVSDKEWKQYCRVISADSEGTCVLGFNNVGKEYTVEHRASTSFRRKHCKSTITVGCGIVYNYISNLALLDKARKSNQGTSIQISAVWNSSILVKEQLNTKVEVIPCCRNQSVG